MRDTTIQYRSSIRRYYLYIGLCILTFTYDTDTYLTLPLEFIIHSIAKRLCVWDTNNTLYLKYIIINIYVYIVNVLSHLYIEFKFSLLNKFHSHHFSQLLELWSGDSFRQDISYHVSGGTISNVNDVVSNCFSNKMISNLDMFCSVVEDGILRCTNSSLVVFPNRGGLFLLTSHFFQKSA